MSIKEIFQPKPSLSDQEVKHGLRMLTWEGMASMGFFSITTSGFLAAFALALGANNFQIGILAAIPFITSPLQIPVILLVERLRQRKFITIATWFLAQGLWIPMALIPIFIGVPSGGAISILLVLITIRGIFAAVTSCGWNSWLRDLVPREILGHVFSRRLALATIVAVVFSLAAAFFVDYWRAHASGENAVFGYTIAFLFGALFLGLASPVFMCLMPEPQMQPGTEPKLSLRKTLTSPLQDKNFRQLMKFLLFWGFASNLAIPFFAVYMLERLGMPLSTVIGLSVLSQLFNILFLRVWGPLADHFGSKAVLSLCASLYLLVILGWTFTTMPEQHFLTIPLLVILHIFAGIATAGVTLTVGTIGLKLAPQGQATPYLAGASLATSLGIGLGPLFGGLFADFFSVRQFTISLTWADPTRALQWPVLYLTGFDFLFAVAFIMGLVTLNTLTKLREEGEIGREIVLGELLSRTRPIARAVSSVPGLGFVTAFPFSYLRQVPGIDVAISVTAYQLADMAKTTTLVASRGLRLTSRVAKMLENGLSQMLKPAKAAPVNGIDVARHTARGAIHAAHETSLNTEQLIPLTMVGIVRALKRAKVNPQDAFRGTGYGVIQGAVETGANLVEAVAQAVAGAREAARMLGLTEEEAATQTAHGALAAIEEMDPEALGQVRAALPPELTEISCLKPEQEDNCED
ncbi:MAG TPA: MFS transporter [Dehalococcoidia bacterium]|nr:MFS transporter [Dehalococcoidia bacterium]